MRAGSIDVKLAWHHVGARELPPARHRFPESAGTLIDQQRHAREHWSKASCADRLGPADELIQPRNDSSEGDG